MKQDTPPPATITAEQAAELHAATLKNIVDKVAAGGIPTGREMEMLRAATAAPADARDRRTPPRQLSIRQLSALTGKTRESIAQRLAKLAHTPGAKGAKCYDGAAALEQIFTGNAGTDENGNFITEGESRRRLNIAKEAQIRLQNEVTRKNRIPIADIEALQILTFGNMAGIIKGRLGAVMDADTINSLFEELRGINAAVEKWKGEQIPTAPEAAFTPP